MFLQQWMFESGVIVNLWMYSVLIWEQSCLSTITFLSAFSPQQAQSVWISCLNSWFRYLSEQRPSAITLKYEIRPILAMEFDNAADETGPLGHKEGSDFPKCLFFYFLGANWHQCPDQKWGIWVKKAGVSLMEEQNYLKIIWGIWVGFGVL